MRTTITLDDTSYEIATAYASAKGVTLSSAIGELIQKSQASPPPSRIKRGRNGFPVLASRGKAVTQSLVKKLEAEESA
jgi:hypothetical protein